MSSSGTLVALHRKSPREPFFQKDVVMFDVRLTGAL